MTFTHRNSINLVVIQPTAFCNIACRYCYLSEKDEKSCMSDETLTRVFQELLQYKFKKNILRICWHAGEPTILPADYYENAFNIIDGLNDSNVIIQHFFQTNAMLINDRWCELFKKYDVKIGVSIDGPKIIHDINRVDRKGRGTYEATIRGIDHLVNHAIKFEVIAVLTKQSLSMAEEIFDFFVSNNFGYVCFNIEEVEGINSDSTLCHSSIEQEFKLFFDEYYTLLKQANFPHSVREIDTVLNRVLNSDINNPSQSMVEPLRHVNIDRFGNFSTFCPELLGVHTTEYGQFYFGNLNSNSIKDCLASKKFIDVSEDIQKGVELCKDTCTYFGFCGGGTPANKYFENGTFATTETMYCRLKTKILIDLAIDWIENAIKEKKNSELLSEKL